jgi:hypothetical protein
VAGIPGVGQDQISSVINGRYGANSHSDAQTEAQGRSRRGLRFRPGHGRYCRIFYLI